MRRGSKPVLIIAGSAVVALALGLGLHDLRLIPTAAMLPFFAAYVLGLIVGWGRLFERTLRGQRLESVADGLWPVAAAIGLALASAPVVFATALYLHSPMIAEISTDLDHPPHFLLLATRPGRLEHDLTRFGGNTALQQAAYPDLGPRLYAGSPDDVMTAFQPALEHGGDSVAGLTRNGDGGLTIELQHRAGLLGLDYAFALRLTQDGPSTRVDIRCASRLELPELGSCKDGILRYFGLLDHVQPAG